MNHQKYKNNNLIFQLKFSDRTTDWSDYDCMEIDCEDLFIEYMSKHKLANQKTDKMSKDSECRTGEEKCGKIGKAT